MPLDLGSSFLSAEVKIPDNTKLNVFLYDRFELLDKVGNNVYKHNLPPIYVNLLCSECGESKYL